MIIWVMSLLLANIPGGNDYIIQGNKIHVSNILFIKVIIRPMLTVYGYTVFTRKSAGALIKFLRLFFAHCNTILCFWPTVLLRINAGGVHLIFDIFWGAFIQGRRLHEGGVYYKIQKSYNSIYQRQ